MLIIGIFLCHFFFYPLRVRDIQPYLRITKAEPPQVKSTVEKGVKKTCEDSSSTQAASDEPHFDPFAPQLRLDADGNIVLDEKSLQISHPANPTAPEDLRHVSEDAEVYGTTYNSFRRRPIQQRGRKWTEKATTKFYRALSTIGTDFYCMTKLFPDRTRNQLLVRGLFECI